MEKQRSRLMIKAQGGNCSHGGVEQVELHEGGK